jgi:hypothetical protein
VKRAGVAIGAAVAVLIGVLVMAVPSAAAATTEQLVQIRPFHAANKCLDVPQATQADINIIQFQCNSIAKNQKFRLVKVAGFSNRYEIRPLHITNGNKCLTVAGNSTLNSALIIQSQCVGGANQQFRIQSVSFGKIECLHPGAFGKVFDIQGGSTADGGRLIQFDANPNANNQLFQFFPVNPWSQAFR